MDIKTTRADFNGSIILGIGSNSNIYDFFKYDLNIKSDNYYNSGCYGWNYSIRSLNNTLKGLKYDVYITMEWAMLNIIIHWVIVKATEFVSTI